ncbi:MAG: prolipoprotein diacylglyceryl transferase family protein [Clostridia bacterium]
MGIVEAGKYIEVHPTFLYESMACFAIFIILILIKNKRKFKGQIACTYFILYSLERFFVEGLRTDSLMLGSIRVSQMLSLIIFVVSSTIYIVKWNESKVKV